MGIFDRVKNLFTDEIEEEIKTETIQVEIPAPARVEPIKNDNVADNLTIKNEVKASVPIFFDDEYFKELEKPKVEPKSSYKKVATPVEKKIFKATPIISPVYGVLDKNYHKEEIFSKNSKKSVRHASTDIDDIRKKAFGTLEDDIETTLFGSKSILFNDETNNNTYTDEIDLFENMTEDTIDIDLSSDDLDNPITNDDLFDLIDTMYEGDKK